MTHSGNDLADRLAILMRAAGIGNGAVAEATGVDITTVSKWRSKKPGAQKPDRAKLRLIVELLKRHGVTTTVEEIEGVNGGSSYLSSRPIAAAMGVRETMGELRFTSSTAAQKGRVWLEQFLLELAEEGAADDFLDSARRLLLNPSNYEHGFGAAAGSLEMDDDRKLRHMKALAVGIRAALKDQKGGRGR